MVKGNPQYCEILYCCNSEPAEESSFSSFSIYEVEDSSAGSEGLSWERSLLLLVFVDRLVVKARGLDSRLRGNDTRCGFVPEMEAITLVCIENKKS